MFATPDQMPDEGLPQFETRKALIVLSMQNDAFYVNDDFFLIKNRDMLPRLKEMIPYFRKHGDIIWVRTEMGTLPPTQLKDLSTLESESATAAERNRQARLKEESHLEGSTSQTTSDTQENEGIGITPMIYRSSKARDLAAQHSADIRAKMRAVDLQVYDDGDNVLREQLTKPRKGQQPPFFIAGTKGAEICDELKDLVDEDDMMLVKHFYSAFDQTSLLMSLRMNLCTEIYLCGCFTNTSVYATAADAVQHGLQVTVVEDCLAYRNEGKHEEALREMADVMGANGIDSEELIEESGGREIPDSEAPGITLQDLSLGSKSTNNQVLSTRKEQGRPDAIQPTLQKSTATAKKRSSTSESLQKSSKGTPTHGRNRRSVGPGTLGPGDKIGSGDSRILLDGLTSQIVMDAFEKLKDEISWQKMYHRDGEVPRLVAVQGEVGADGSVPIYRHPSDQSPPLLPFTQTINIIRDEVQNLLRQPFNHALIQLYRSGEDNISEHADKTLDIVRGSHIINVSLGAQRVMTLRRKKGIHSQIAENSSVRLSQRIKLPHNSIFVLGPQTNREWLHGVRPDKRPSHEKTEEELSFDGERISITFRSIGTFLHQETGKIWGSGATIKTKANAAHISNVDSEVEKLIIAFGKENHDPEFDWDVFYGSGFDVVDLVVRSAKLKLCADPVANMRARLALSYKAIVYESINTSSPEEFEFCHTPWTHGLSNLEKPSFRESKNAPGTDIEGDLTILFYLESQYPSAVLEGIEGYTNPQLFRCAAQSNELLYAWREMLLQPPQSPTHRFRLERPTTPNSPLQKEIQQVLQSWEDYLEEEEYDFVAGEAWTILDCAFWPVLNDVLSHEKGPPPEAFPALTAYHRRGMEKAKEAKAVDSKT